MNHLTPCPECRRHVRVRETTCPFCSASIDLSHVSPPVLPKKRLGRAASFAFQATLVGTLGAACEGESTVVQNGGSAGESASGRAGAGRNSGGSSGQTGVGGGVTPVGGRGGGIPGVGGRGGADGNGGSSGFEELGGYGPEYGGAPAWGGEDGGDVPIYGSPPSEGGEGGLGGGGSS